MFSKFKIGDSSSFEIERKRSLDDPETFWSEFASEFLWKRKWSRVSNWNFSDPDIRWFEGGICNITENCLDRIASQTPDKIALIWEPNDPSDESKMFSYLELLHKVNQCCNVLRQAGVKKHDRVCIYMGMIPEIAIAMLACARIGAIHSVVFGGFSANALRERILDCKAEWIMTCDGAWRGPKEISLKSIVDEAIQNLDFVKRVWVQKHTGSRIDMILDRDVWLNEVLEHQSTEFDAEPLNSEDPLFILYTSGSTGKPKGVVHTVGGYMIWTAYTFLNVFQYRDGQKHFCTADAGWITGHSYVLYGPLLNGATSLMFEGIPTWPDASRFWKIVDKHQVNILYTAPTAIRSLMAFGDQPFKNIKLNSLEVLGTVGEPINEEAWHWYHEKVGKTKIPIVDTWWQTETGGIMISNLANVTDQIPGYATRALPGVSAKIINAEGYEISKPGEQGLLVIDQAWPGMIRSTYGDHDRCRKNYFTQYPGMYFTGDAAFKDEHGNFRIIGRVDDVLNVSGHRIGTAELENAINEHPHIIESAVVGFPHVIKGQGIYAFVITNHKTIQHDVLKSEINLLLNQMIGPIAKADRIQIVPGLPKTRSGKIMRRILRKIAEGEKQDFGDITSLLDMDIVRIIADQSKLEK